MMTIEQKLIEAAKMDVPHQEWEIMKSHWNKDIVAYRTLSGLGYEECKRYNESYDAIIPLIQKQDEAMVERITELIASDRVDRLTATDVLFATPSQLLDALLSAKGFEV